jgi:methanogenic corrinoid protein MtbC1
MVKWLKARQAEGLSISRAVDLWREITASGRDPLAGVAPAATRAVAEPPQAPPAHIEALRQNWLKAALSYNTDQAEDVLNQAFALYSPETVCVEILQKGLNSIGSQWYQGQVTVQQEHFVSALAVRRLETLITLMPRPTRRQTILMGCPQGEWHTLPVLLLTLFVRREGLNVIYLGANVPISRMVETAIAIHPDLSVLAAQQLTTAASIQAAATAFLEHKLPLAYGGLIFNRIPELRSRIPAHFLGERLEESAATIEKLALHPAPFPEAAPDESGRALAQLYQEKRPLIELGINQQFQKEGRLAEYLADVNGYLGGELVAALELGNLAYVEPDMEWIRQFLSVSTNMKEDLFSYLTAYREMILKELGPAGAPMANWIADYLNRDETTPAGPGKESEVPHAGS